MLVLCLCLHRYLPSMTLSWDIESDRIPAHPQSQEVTKIPGGPLIIQSNVSLISYIDLESRLGSSLPLLDL